MTMQAFYSKLQQADTPPARGLQAIARAGLRKVLALRSELEWLPWDGNPTSR